MNRPAAPCTSTKVGSKTLEIRKRQGVTKLFRREPDLAEQLAVFGRTAPGMPLSARRDTLSFETAPLNEA